MTHTLPSEIYALLEKWDNLGFNCKKEAAEFILANKDWKELIKDAGVNEADSKVVNVWRDRILNVEKDHALTYKGTV